MARRSVTFVLVLGVHFCLATPIPAAAAGDSPPGEDRTSAPATADACAEAGADSVACGLLAEETGWGLDSTHERVTEGVENTARWLDGFLGTGRAEAEANFSYLRLTPTLSRDNREGTGQNLKVRGKIDLPDRRRRLSLIFSGEDDEDIIGISDTNSNTTFDVRDADERSVGLQFLARRSRLYHSSVNATLTSGFQPKLSARVRRQIAPDSERFTSFASVRPYWHGEDGFGVRLDGESTLALGPQLLLRTTTAWDRYEEIDGWEWNASSALYYRLESRALIALAFDGQGVTSPRLGADSWTLGPFYRRNLWRPWMFASVKPFVRWRGGPNFRNERFEGVIVELDIVFGDRG
ncbi:MAG TPA: hypothetical protein VLA56_13355 [Pseudomonadales bacterium]|nr:hypothetical protein [Pseudomonadales bacterium]